MALTPQQEELLNRHLDLVLEANKQVNLTSITDKEQAKILHIQDSLAGLKYLEGQNFEVLDMGSGAGYPGIPLAICSGLKTTLCETAGKKADWLKSFISDLGLEAQVSVSNCRIEELAAERPNSYGLITARALSSLSSLLELASPLLMTKGRILCYKSLDIENEINEASSILDLLGFSFVEANTYDLPNNLGQRQILVYEKISDSKIKLPRKMGFAQKKPLKS